MRRLRATGVKPPYRAAIAFTASTLTLAAPTLTLAASTLTVTASSASVAALASALGFRCVPVREATASRIDLWRLQCLVVECGSPFVLESGRADLPVPGRHAVVGKRHAPNGRSPVALPANGCSCVPVNTDIWGRDLHVQHRVHSVPIAAAAAAAAQASLTAALAVLPSRG